MPPMSNTSEMPVTEKFLSIQGESTRAGRLCYFIRVAGCNLKCSYCDTLYSRRFEDGHNESIDMLTTSVRTAGVGLVEITGGEPLLHRAVPELCARLLEDGREVMVETNGSLDISVLPEGTIRILDCKTPSSGESERMDTGNYSRLTRADEVKFVLADRRDYDFASEIIRRYELEKHTTNLVFSTVWNTLAPATLAKWMISDRSPARLQLQMHKIIWGAETKGV